MQREEGWRIFIFFFNFFQVAETKIKIQIAAKRIFLKDNQMEIAMSQCTVSITRMMKKKYETKNMQNMQLQKFLIGF